MSAETPTAERRGPFLVDDVAARLGMLGPDLATWWDDAVEQLVYVHGFRRAHAELMALEWYEDEARMARGRTH